MTEQPELTPGDASGATIHPQVGPIPTPVQFDLGTALLPNGAPAAIMQIFHATGQTVLFVDADTLEMIGRASIQKANEIRSTPHRAVGGLIVPGSVAPPQNLRGDRG